MERFDPRAALTTAALATSGWIPGEPGRRGNSGGEQPIGELVRAIVARLAPQDVDLDAGD
jgi:hypothetical protein